MSENNFKQKEIGLIPEDWGVVRLKNVAHESRGNSKKYIPSVKIEDITASGKYISQKE